MIRKDLLNRPSALINTKMSVILDYTNGFRIKHWLHQSIAGNVELPDEVFEIEIAGELYKRLHLLTKHGQFVVGGKHERTPSLSRQGTL